MICKLFIAITISCLEESAAAKKFSVIPCSYEFREFLSTKFAVCSKPPSRDNHCKASYPRMYSNMTKVNIEPTPSDQSWCKNDAFPLSLTLPCCLPQDFFKFCKGVSALILIAFLWYSNSSKMTFTNAYYLLALLLVFIAGKSPISEHKNTHLQKTTRTHKHMLNKKSYIIGRSWFFTKSWDIPPSYSVLQYA